MKKYRTKRSLIKQKKEINYKDFLLYLWLYSFKIIILIILFVLIIRAYHVKSGHDVNNNNNHNNTNHNNNHNNNNHNNNSENDDNLSFTIKIGDKTEKIWPSKLSQEDHYKILLPRVKAHTFKKIYNPDEPLFKLEESKDSKIMKETGKDQYIYHSCIIAGGKYENLYLREFIDYYVNFGIEKFYLGDDDPEDIENFSDVIGDYIEKGIVDVEYIYYRNYSLAEYFEMAFRSVRTRCKWFLFYDIDEYLEFKDKNMTLKSYLDMPIFDNCDVVKIHWMEHNDNNLLYYDNRPLKERLNNSLPNNHFARFHKSILRGKDYGGIVFSPETMVHSPNQSLITKQCDAVGNIEILSPGSLGSPIFKYGFIRHYSYKTSEEFAIKMMRGSSKSVKYDYNELMDLFNSVNEITEEKLKIIEHIVNRTFPKYHKHNN